MKQLRVLIALALLFHGIGLFLLPLLPFLFSSDTLELMKYSGHGARLAMDHPLIFYLYLLPYPALLGVWFLRKWGGYVLLTFVTIVLIGSFYFGASVSGPPETFVSLAATLLDGAILALVFCRPIQSCASSVPSVRE